MKNLSKKKNEFKGKIITRLEDLFWSNKNVKEKCPRCVLSVSLEFFKMY